MIKDIETHRDPNDKSARCPKLIKKMFKCSRLLKKSMTWNHNFVNHSTNQWTLGRLKHTLMERTFFSLLQMKKERNPRFWEFLSQFTCSGVTVHFTNPSPLFDCLPLLSGCLTLSDCLCCSTLLFLQVNHSISLLSFPFAHLFYLFLLSQFTSSCCFVRIPPVPTCWDEFSCCFAAFWVLELKPETWRSPPRVTFSSCLQSWLVGAVRWRWWCSSTSSADLWSLADWNANHQAVFQADSS